MFDHQNQIYVPKQSSLIPGTHFPLDNLNLYVNSSEIGKLYMRVAGDCRKRSTRRGDDMIRKSIDRIALKAVADKSSVQVNIEQLTAGSYPYILFVNGIKQDAKIMPVVR